MTPVTHSEKPFVINLVRSTEHSLNTLLPVYYTYFVLLIGLLVTDALLHTTVVMCGYLCSCHLIVSFDQSGPFTSELSDNNAL